MGKRPEGSLISHFSRLVTQKGGINLAQGKPGFPPPAELLQILRKKSFQHQLHQYAPGNGDFELLDLLAEHHSRVRALDTENILVVQGATEGIFLGFFYLTGRLTPPYSALSFEPVYESHPQLAKILDIPFQYFDFESDLSIDFNRLETVIREKNVKVVFVTSPGNPLGRIWSKEELTELLGLSRRLDFFIIFDGVYIDLFFQHKPGHPLELPALHGEFDRLIFVGSFSKMLSITGWRVGHIIADKSHMNRIRAIHDYTGLSAPALFQSALAEYLRQHDYGLEYLHSIRGKCRQSYRYMKKELEKAGLVIPEIGGGYFLWARLPEQWPDGYRFARELVNRKKVAVVPGENFSPFQKQYIRINIALDFSMIRKGAEKIKAFLSSE